MNEMKIGYDLALFIKNTSEELNGAINIVTDSEDLNICYSQLLNKLDEAEANLFNLIRTIENMMDGRVKK